MLLTVSENKQMLDVLETIAKNTKNDAILVIIVLLAGIIFLVPTIGILLSKKRKADSADQKMFMDVINRNTEAFTDLKITLSKDSVTTQTLLQSIANDAHYTRDKINDVISSQKQIKTSMDELKDNAGTIAHDTTEQGVKIEEILDYEKQHETTFKKNTTKKNEKNTK